MQETQVRSLGWEDPLEEETATHSSILAWKIPWTEEPGGLQSMRLQRVRHEWVTAQIIDYSIQNILASGNSLKTACPNVCMHEYKCCI